MTQAAPADSRPADRAPGYEPRDLPAWGIGVTILGVLLGTLLCGAVAYAIVAAFAARQPAPVPALSALPQVPPAPRLSVDPQADGEAVNRAAEAKLEGYAWVDPAAGRVRIPIERAMELLARQGWPDQDRAAVDRPGQLRGTAR